MRKTLTFIVPVLALVFVIFNSCQSTQKTSSSDALKFNLQKGKLYDYNMDLDIAPPVPGSNMKSNMKSNYTLEVTDDNGGVKTIKTTFGRMVFNLPGDSAVQIDTDKPAEPGKDGPQMMHRVFKSMVGQSFVMKVNSEGKILEITGLNDLRNAMVSSLGLTGEEAQRANGMVGLAINSDNLKKSFEQTFFIFPDKAVKVGDSWTKEMEMGGMFPFKISSTYTVKSVEGGHATINMDSKISSSAQGSMNGTQTGVFVVEMSSGLVINADFTQDIVTTSPEGTSTTSIKGHVTGQAR